MELRTVTAAFFRSKGKTVVTEKEFLMGVSMTLRWMPHGDAEKLLKAMIKGGAVIKDGEYIKPSFDVSEVDVPIGYRPSKDLIAGNDEAVDVFQTLLGLSADVMIDRKEFMAQCRNIQKKMNVEIEVAALIVLRDHGVPVSGYVEKVQEAVSKR
jgi:Uncharacterized protein conserved in archaea